MCLISALQWEETNEQAWQGICFHLKSLHSINRNRVSQGRDIDVMFGVELSFKTLENHDFQGLILLKDVHFSPTDRSLCKMFSEWRSCMACWHPLPAVLAFVEWVQCSDLNPPRLNGWIREHEKQRRILMIAVEHVAWNVDSYMTYLQGFQILWLLESYGEILMWKLSNLDSSKWFSIILGTSITQSSSLWHHLDKWQNSNKITVPPGGLNET